MPPAGEQFWEWFWDINHGRQAGPTGWLPLSATELKAWEAMTGNIVRREEWQFIREMDRAYLDMANSQGKEGQLIASSSNEMTTDAFDAVFG